MPKSKVSKFYGISVEMEPDPNYLPHLFATYKGSEAMFSAESGVFMEGEFPKKERSIVKAWVLLHKEEIMDNWNDGLSDPNFKIKLIAPLE